MSKPCDICGRRSHTEDFKIYFTRNWVINSVFQKPWFVHKCCEESMKVINKSFPASTIQEQMEIVGERRKVYKEFVKRWSPEDEIEKIKR